MFKGGASAPLLLLLNRMDLKNMDKKEWFIPDMYWPEKDNGHYTSHEAICILNTNDEVCRVDITFYFENCDPVQCKSMECPPQRVVHIHTPSLRLENGKCIPRGVGYAAKINCSVPAVVQYTRVDTTQEPLALMTTMAY